MIALKKGIVPYYRRSESVRGMMVDMLIPLALLLVIPVVNHGFRPLVTVGVCCLTCLLCEILFCLFSRRDILVSDLSFAVTGTIVAMLLPVNIPFYVAGTACLFAVLAVKMPFGGTGRSPFNPAAAGIAFVTISFPSLVFAYRNPASSAPMPAFAAAPSVETAASPAALLKEGARPLLEQGEMIFGKFAGPMGATAVLVIAACAVYLVFRRAARWETMVSYLAAAALFSALFPRLNTGRMDSLQFELLSGSLVFCAVFMITEPATSPKTPLGRCMYGFLGGVLTMVFRYFGAHEQGACFALLLVNAGSAAFDRLTWRLFEHVDVPDEAAGKGADT